jgi:small nuclear ribonucleoprotein
LYHWAIHLSVDLAVKMLEKSLGKIVLIKLKGSRAIRGVLKGYDQHMNFLLEQSEEIMDDGKASPLGTIVVRGDNVILISPSP